jgi:hypothetical protein
MRIGELLVGHKKLRQSDLTRALAEKPADKRLCSFLIAKGLLEFDDASRALGEQMSVPCALTKHLAGRDPSLSKLIPAELGRSSLALPIGRSSKGTLIVCVRDPAPALLAALKQAVKTDITMVIAPASRLEHLVQSAYGDAPTEEFDVDFSTGVNSNPATPIPLVKKLASGEPPPMLDMDALDAALDADSVRLALTDLDDARVDKDFTQSGQIPIPKNASGSTLPPANVSSTSKPLSQPMPVLSRTATPNRVTKPMSVGAISVGLEHATSRETATDLVLAAVAQRWRSGLVLAIRDTSAIGYRGHGVQMPEMVSVPLSVPSTVQRAVETRFISAETPTSAAQDALSRALGAKSPAAAPVLVRGKAVAVILVGEPLDASANAAAELAMLAEALGTAYQRVMAR